MPSRRSQPTIVDVALSAGVSRGTASNVFAHPERVRPELRARVEAAARDLGYAGPDPRGRLLRAGRYKALGFVIPGAYGIVNLLQSPYGRELTLGIGEACDAANVGLTLLDGRPGQMENAIRDALVDGVVLGHGNAPALMEAARQRRLPLVVLDTPAGSDLGAVTIAARDGARAAARHLIGLGHKKFVIVTVRRTPGDAIVHKPGANRELTEGFPLDRLKLEGYAEAFTEAGLSLDDMPLVESLPWDNATGVVARAAAPEATALLVMSDRQALAILDDFRRSGIRVPEQLSIVGFDDVPEAAAANLTTVAQPIREKGRLAADMLLQDKGLRQIDLPTRLVVRGSTARPHQR